MFEIIKFLINLNLLSLIRFDKYIYLKSDCYKEKHDFYQRSQIGRTFRSIAVSQPQKDSSKTKACHGAMGHPENRLDLLTENCK
jgi:hypothetical protein